MDKFLKEFFAALCVVGIIMLGSFVLQYEFGPKPKNVSEQVPPHTVPVAPTMPVAPKCTPGPVEITLTTSQGHPITFKVGHVAHVVAVSAAEAKRLGLPRNVRAIVWTKYHHRAFVRETAGDIIRLEVTATPCAAVS